MKSLFFLLSSIIPVAAAAAADSPPQGVLLEFSSSRCVPCQQMSPTVSRLQRQGYPIRKVDVDRQRSLARRYRITSLPAFVLIINGKEAARLTGIKSESQLKRLMARIPKREPSPTVLAASSRPRSRQNPPQPPAAQRMAADDRSKAKTFPRFQFPFFGSKKKKSKVPLAASASSTPLIIRAKHDRPASSSNDVVVVDPLAASTRIRIKDETGINFGSGTIVDSRPGRTIVLTCGHIFRGLKQSAAIEVDVFHGDGPQRYLGSVIRYDLEADVGLIAIATDSALPISRIAAIDSRILRNDPVVSIGCSRGEPPSTQQLRVTALNRYLGPDNIECTGLPVLGRSGGGLFNADAKVIGVCIAAEPKERVGLYAGLKAIHKLLDQADLARLYRRVAGPKSSWRREIPDEATLRSRPATPPTDETRQTDTEVAGIGTPFNSTEKQPGVELELGDHGQSRPQARPTGGGGNTTALSLFEGAEGAEVICIIRPIDKPRSASRVVIINRASRKFLAYLRGELQQQPQPTMGTLNPPRARPSSPKLAPTSADGHSRETTRFKESAGRPLVRQLQKESTNPHNWRAASSTTQQRQPSASAAVPQRYRRSAASRR